MKNNTANRFWLTQFGHTSLTPLRISPNTNVWRSPLSDETTLPVSGFVRLPRILPPNGPIPVSKSTWWAGVKSGRYPQPVKLGPRITAWRVEDIRKLIDRGVA